MSQSRQWSLVVTERKAKNLCLLMQAPGTICTRCPLLCCKPPPKLKRTAQLILLMTLRLEEGWAGCFSLYHVVVARPAQSLKIRRHVHLSGSQGWNSAETLSGAGAGTPPQGLSWLLDVLAAWCLGSMAVCRQGGGQKLCCSIARMAIREKLVAEDHACAEGWW